MQKAEKEEKAKQREKLKGKKKKKGGGTQTLLELLYTLLIVLAVCSVPLFIASFFTTLF